MSYILDALRKAERERDPAQIPTLTTVHDIRGTSSRRLPWIIFGTSVAFISLLVGIGFFLMKPSSEPGPSKIGISGVEEEASATPIPNRGAEVPIDLVAPHQVVEPKVQPVPSSGTGVVPGVTHAPPSSQVQKEPVSSSPAAKEPNPPQAKSKTPQSETTESTPASATPPSKPLDLNEAVAKMNMTILFYSETKSERMVFIDGRRYAEGDYVDGFYLIESITPEGAWLSYQGNRAILRPKTQ